MTETLITNYAENTSNWEEWQQEYKYGALYIFPPDDLRNYINSLRKKHDPKSQAICDAHISLTVPLPKALNQTDWKRLEEQTRTSLSKVEISYGPVHTFPEVPGVVLLIEPADTLRNFVSQIEKIKLFKDAKKRSFRFTPHMTIAEYISLKRTQELYDKLKEVIKSGSFSFSQISYAVPDEDFHFTERNFIELK